MDLNFGSYIPRLFQIESGGNPYNRTGSNRGLGQFGPQEEQQYGITNWTDPQQQVSAVQREAQAHIPLLTNTLGRPPSPGELYLAHQQGAAGGPALLSASPDLPAWQVIRPFYKSDAIAKKAISGNIPSNSVLSGIPSEMITAGDFRNLWVNKFEGGNAPMAYASSSGRQMPDQTTPQPMSFGNMIGSNQNAILGYLAGALQGGNLGQSIGRGIGGFLSGENIDIQHQAMGAAAQGLAKAGLNPAMAQAVAANPQYLQAFMATMPQFKTIQDALGGQVPVWVNPFTQTISPASASSSQVSGAGGGITQTGIEAGVAKVAQMAQEGKSKQEMLNEVPIAIRSYVADMLEGKDVPTNLGMRAGPIRAAALMYAHSIEPGFNESMIAARGQYLKDLGRTQPTALGGQWNSANAMPRHLGEVLKSFEALGNSNGPETPGGILQADAAHAYNAAANTRGSSEQKGKVNALQNALDIYGPERTKFIAGTPGTGLERSEASNTYAHYKTPQEAGRAALAEIKIYEEKLNALEEQQQRQMGPNFKSSVDPKTRAAIAEAKQIATRMAGMPETPAGGTTQSVPPGGGWTDLGGGIKIRQK